MKVTTIDMGKVKDKKKPFDNASWSVANKEQEAKFYKILANVKIAQQAS